MEHPHTVARGWTVTGIDGRAIQVLHDRDDGTNPIRVAELQAHPVYEDCGRFEIASFGQLTNYEQRILNAVCREFFSCDCDTEWLVSKLCMLMRH